MRDVPLPANDETHPRGTFRSSRAREAETLPNLRCSRYGACRGGLQLYEPGLATTRSSAFPRRDAQIPSSLFARGEKRVYRVIIIYVPVPKHTRQTRTRDSTHARARAITAFLPAMPLDSPSALRASDVSCSPPLERRSGNPPADKSSDVISRRQRIPRRD